MMKYELIIKNSKLKDGTISLEQLASLSEVLLDIAKDALQIRLEGLSKSRGKRPSQITKAIQISLSGLKKGSTVLELQSPTFKESLPSIQLDLFDQDLEQLIESETPVSLIIQSFKDVLHLKGSQYIDKPLLKDMRRLKNVLRSDLDTLIIRNGQKSSSISLMHDDFKKIQIMEDQTPDPQKVIFVGKLDELVYSKSKVNVITEKGKVTGYLTEELRDGDIKQYWGKELSIVGTAHYKPGGKISFLHIEQIDKPTKRDAFFRAIPKSETIDEQIDRQKKEGKSMKPIKSLIGVWPEDDSLDELLSMLRK